MEEGKLLVQDGKNNDVLLAAGSKRVPLVPRRHCASPLGSRKVHYGDIGSVRFRRESGALVVTLVPKKAAEQELRLGEAESLQLAAAVASVRQNVSKAGQ
jgi:hypothetical protein